MNPLALTPGVTVVRADTDPAPRTLADDVHDGLTRPFKELPPKHLYDDHGSALFAAICELPEYHPSRTERLILEQRAGEIAELTGAAEVIELGSGYATKTRVLLDALAAAGTLRRYVPLDVSAVTQAGNEIARDYGIDVWGIVGDFERDLDVIPEPCGAGGNRLVAMLGAFNRNILTVINRELGADFAVERFEHVAFFDREQEWLDVRLRAPREHVVTVEALGLRVPFAAGEDLRTEISSKFTPARPRRRRPGAGTAADRRRPAFRPRDLPARPMLGEVVDPAPDPADLAVEQLLVTQRV
jgi:L-histidine N-alpha-methyltransferase